MTEFMYGLHAKVWLRKGNRLLLGKIVGREQRTLIYSISTDEGLYLAHEDELLTREQIYDECVSMEEFYGNADKG